MKQFILIIAAMVLMTSQLGAESLPGWSTNLTATLESVRSSPRPVVIDFTASWCGPCKMMAATTLKDTNVLKGLEAFATVSIDIDEQPPVAQRFSVSAIPTFVLLTPDGEEVARQTGFQDAKAFDAWLRQGATNVAAALKEKAEFLQQQESLLAALKGSDAAAKKKAISDLYDLCGHKEPSRRTFALAQLKELVAADPKQLYEGLNHPKLATRIVVANLLREKLGANFKFDPWEKAEVRQRAVEKLR